MRVWNIELWLEGGVRISGRWKGYEPNSSRVMEKILAGPLNEVIDMYGTSDNSRLFVKRGSIMACEISQ